MPGHFFRNTAFTACILLCALSLSAQNFLRHLYDSGETDAAGCIEALNGGDFLLGGACQSDGNLCLSRLNPVGDVLWTVQYEVGASALATDILPSNDGLFMMIYRYVDNGLTFSGWMKFNAVDGSIVWHKKSSGPCRFYKIAAHPGGYVMAGTAVNGADEDLMIVKINETGTAQWTNRYGTPGDDEMRDLWVDAQGFIFAAGFGSDAGNTDGVLSKLGPSGDLLWTFHYGSAGVEAFTAVAPLDNDKLLLAGFSNTNNPDFYDVWAVSVDQTGKVRWSKTWQMTETALGAAGLLALPGNQFVIGVTDPESRLGSLAGLLKINEGGDLLWAKAFKSGGETDILRHIGPHKNGFAAAATAVVGGKADAYAFTCGPNGEADPLCCPKDLVLKANNETHSGKTFLTGAKQGVFGIASTPNALPAKWQSAYLCKEVDLSFTVKDSLICPSACTEIEVTGNTPGVQYSLSVLGGEPDPLNPDVVCHTEGDMLRIIRKADNGICEQKLIVEVPVDTQSYLIPNAFTPNGDMYNNTFMPVFNCPVDNVAFRVYSRWGELVFQADESGKGWDGTINGLPATSDIYVWTLSFEYVRNGTVVQASPSRGDVTLLR